MVLLLSTFGCAETDAGVGGDGVVRSDAGAVEAVGATVGCVFARSSLQVAATSCAFDLSNTL